MGGLLLCFPTAPLWSPRPPGGPKVAFSLRTSTSLASQGSRVHLRAPPSPVTEEAARPQGSGAGPCPLGSGESSTEVQHPAPLAHPLHPGLRWGLPSRGALKIPMPTESPLERVWTGPGPPWRKVSALVSGSFYVLRKALGLTLLGAVTWARAVNILSLFLLRQNG